MDWNSNPTRTTEHHLKRIISTNYCIRTVVPPDDGHRYARNKQKFTKRTRNKLCIKLVFLYTFGSLLKTYLFNKCVLCISTVKHTSSGIKMNLVPMLSCGTETAWTCSLLEYSLLAKSALKLLICIFCFCFHFRETFAQYSAF